MLFVLLGLHLVAALIAPLLARRLGRGVLLIAGLAPAATVVWAATVAGRVLDGGAVEASLTWASSLGVELGLRLDGFGLLFVGLVSGIGVLIFAYAHGYFAEPRSDLGRFTAALTGFAGSMLGLVIADNLLVLFVFWELTSITSYLLIGFEDQKAESRAAAQHALLVTAGGGLALLAGLVLLGQAAGTFSLAELLAAAPSGPLVEAGLVLALVGAFTKSAQVPFHAWLPGAMAAPTPVSAYLHSATMVKAGVYLVARLAPGFAEESVVWLPLVVVVGALTMLVGGYRALRQHDLKLLLAYGTVSQLGFLVVVLGIGSEEAALAGAVLLLAHGLFKATLFMVAGVIDHSAHTRDVRALTGLARLLPGLFVAALLAGLSMAGLPPLLGFIAKEASFATVLHAEIGGLATIGLVGVVAGSALTVAYTARFLHGAFATKNAGDEVELVDPEHVHRPTRAFVAPAALLAALGLLTGIVPALADPLVVAAGAALQSGGAMDHLALWHGLTAELGLSALAIAAGVGLFLARGPVGRAQARVPRIADATGAYEGAVKGVLLGSKRLTGVVQNGSLPVYLAVILLVTIALPATGLIDHGLPGLPALVDEPAQLWVLLPLLGAVAGAIVAPRRFSAVIFLGGVGFAVGFLFVLQGAPDLALTQFLIETLAIVLFVLVLRHLPAHFSLRHTRFDRGARALVAGLVGVFVFVFALVVGGARTAPPVSGEYLARALPEGEGRNVVNVILVDFRAFDTLGEIVVLVVAAMGIASLVLASRLEARPARSPSVDGDGLAEAARGGDAGAAAQSSASDTAGQGARGEGATGEEPH